MRRRVVQIKPYRHKFGTGKTMRGLVCLAMVGTLASWCATSNADDLPIAGIVVDADGKPVQNAMVSASWRANGSGTKSDGTLLGNLVLKSCCK